MAFDYDSPDVEYAVIAEIATEMSGLIPQVKDDEREARRVEHEAWLAECRERDRQQRLEYKRRRAEAAEAERAEAERQAGIVRARQHEQRRAETAERNRQQARDRTLTGLLNHAVQQQQFRQSALRSAKFAKQRRDLSDGLDNFMQTKFPSTATRTSGGLCAAGRRRQRGFGFAQF